MRPRAPGEGKVVCILSYHSNNSVLFEGKTHKKKCARGSVVFKRPKRTKIIMLVGGRLDARTSGLLSILSCAALYVLDLA